jgi:C4-dicarboxylate-specific signal transduction histidine kinase/ABC-type uncharacterized transport system substrate-binding protein
MTAAMPLCVCLSASAQPADARTVLAVYWSAEEFPANRERDEAIRETLLSSPGHRISYFAEYLESDQFPEKKAALALRDYMVRKYQGRRIDVGLAITDVALDFVLRYRQQLFPDAPIVYLGALTPDASVRAAGAGVTGVVMAAGFRETLALALKLQPSTRRVFVVAKWPNLALESLRAELTAAAPGRELTYFTGESVTKLLEVVRAVPRDSVILYLRYSENGAWHDSTLVARLVAEVSSAPVYAPADGFIGTGVIGGMVFDTPGLGARIGDMTRQIIAGARAHDLPIARAPLVPVFDWRQLRRWSIPESALPPGSVVRFRELSTWERYKTAFMITAAVMLLQSGLIVALLIERRTRRRSQIALRESEDRAEIAGVSLGVGFWTWEPDRDRVWITRQCAWLFGADPAKRMTLDAFLETLRPQIADSAQRAFERAVRDGTAFDGEWGVTQTSGAVRWIAVATRPSADSRGRRHVTGVLVDVTARKTAELQVEEQRREMAHLGRVAMLGEMSGALAHELRQPLMAIRSFAQGSLRLIRDAAELDKVREGLEAILRAEKHAGGVVDRARALVKRNEPRSEELNIDEIVRDTLELAAVQLQARGVTLITNLGAGHLTVRGDRIELQQVLMNVILNGCEAMGEITRSARRLVVTTRGGAVDVRIDVRDEGFGIPEDRLGRVFEPFVTTKQEGLGLGLAICRSIVGSHGGQIRASNNPDRGSTFHICLPRTGPGAQPVSQSSSVTTKV